MSYKDYKSRLKAARVSLKRFKKNFKLKWNNRFIDKYTPFLAQMIYDLDQTFEQVKTKIEVESKLIEALKSEVKATKDLRIVIND